VFSTVGLAPCGGELDLEMWGIKGKE
jgi:hypothetical protein